MAIHKEEGIRTADEVLLKIINSGQIFGDIKRVSRARR